MNKSVIFIALFFFSATSFAQELKLDYELLFELTGTIGVPIEIGQTLYGEQSIQPITGGYFEGPKMKGKVLATGADWLTRLNETTFEVDVRAALETEDGVRVLLYYTGFIHQNPDQTYYFRTTPRFETTSEKYG